VIPGIRRSRGAGVPVRVRVELGARAERAVTAVTAIVSGTVLAVAGVPPGPGGLSLPGAALLILGAIRLRST
jgi:hypothetical protein